jgi:hypothetical protein
VNTVDYTPEIALRSLMSKLTERDPELAARIQTAMDEGKDIDEAEVVKGKGKKKKRREYRKTVPYTDEEALKVALKALEAYFIGQPLFANSLHENMVKTAIGEPRRPRFSSEKREIFPVLAGTDGIEKITEVEMHTETQLRAEMQIARPGQEMQILPRIDPHSIEEQQRNLSRLRELIDFGVE